MALCFAHAAAGYLVYEAVRPAGPHRPALLVAAVGLACAPDLDFVPGIVLGRPGAFHRGVTHTVLAAALAGLVVSLGSWWAAAPWRAWAAGLFAAAAWTSHLLVDFLTVDAVPPYGGRFLWPVSDRFLLSPVTPLREIVIDPSGRTAFFASLLRPHTALAWASDLAVLVLAVAGVHALRAWRAPAPVAGVMEGS